MNSPVPLLDWQRGVIEDPARFCFVVASRQTGKSHGFSLKSVLRCLPRKRLRVMLSAGERQSIELMEKVKMHLRAMNIAMEMKDDFFRDTSILQQSVTMPNGSRIIGLPANPDTARGYSADTFLDEFGLHKDSREIWAALFPTISRGYDLDVASTFKGTENKFYEIGKKLGLHTGCPAQQPVQSDGWSGHWVDVYMAVEQGAPIDPEQLRAAIDDEEVWLQEFCNIPMSGAENFIPLDLVLACESEEASLTWNGEPAAGLCAGMDIGRNRDLSVIVIGQPAFDILGVRGIIWMERMPFAEQAKVAREVATAVESSGGRFAVDATGIGAQLAEELSTQFPCVEPVQFASSVDTGEVKVPVKESMATTLKRRFEERSLRIPSSSKLRRACQSIKRYVGPTGKVRFDAARTDQGHADEFWALALMVSAASGPSDYVPAASVGLVGRAVMSGLMGREF